jgi:hypothetical protein
VRHRAKDGAGRDVLVSVSDGVIRLTTYDHVGDEENKLDELESVWFERLVAQRFTAGSWRIAQLVR